MVQDALEETKSPDPPERDSSLISTAKCMGEPEHLGHNLDIWEVCEEIPPINAWTEEELVRRAACEDLDQGRWAQKYAQIAFDGRQRQFCRDTNSRFAVGGSLRDSEEEKCTDRGYEKGAQEAFDLVKTPQSVRNESCIQRVRADIGKEGEMVLTANGSCGIYCRAPFLLACIGAYASVPKRSAHQSLCLTCSFSTQYLVCYNMFPEGHGAVSRVQRALQAASFESLILSTRPFLLLRPLTILLCCFISRQQ